jgi:hypothetical protein
VGAVEGRLVGNADAAHKRKSAPLTVVLVARRLILPCGDARASNLARRRYALILSIGGATWRNREKFADCANSAAKRESAGAC